MRVNAVYEGDCLDVMRELSDNCIDTIITDPPYALTNRTPDVKRCINCKRVLGGGDGGPIACPKCGGDLSRQRTSQQRGFMGKEWDNEIAFNPEVWREALRIAKPGAYLMAFGGTRTYHRLACAIEDAGWEIRDCVTYLNDGSQAEAAFMASLNDEQLAAYLELHYPSEQIAWVYGSGMGLGYDVSKGIDKSKGAEREVVGKGIYFDRGRVNGDNQCSVGESFDSYITAPATPLAAKFSGFRSRLKPAFEPIVCAMKPIDTNYATNAERWGLAGLDIDGCRVETNGESLSGGAYSENGRQKPMNGDTRKGKSLGMFREGAKPKDDFAQPNGRYPANIIHDGSEQVEAEFAKAGVSVSRPSNIKAAKANRQVYDGGDLHNRIDRSYSHSDSGSASRYFAACPPDLPRFIYQAKASAKERATPGNNHPTQKPLSLIRELAKLTRPPDGGVVLDPFAGSGTTALAAIAEGRDYILIEKEPEYCEIIKRRIAEYTGEEIAPKEVEIDNEQTVKQMPLW